MVSGNEIDFRTYALTMEILREVLDVRWLIPVWGGAGVQCPIVATRSNPSVLFRYDV